MKDPRPPVIEKFHPISIPAHANSTPKPDRFDLAFWYNPGMCGIGKAATETAANREHGAEPLPQDFHQYFLK